MVNIPAVNCNVAGDVEYTELRSPIQSPKVKRLRAGPRTARLALLVLTAFGLGVLGGAYIGAGLQSSKEGSQPKRNNCSVLQDSATKIWPLQPSSGQFESAPEGQNDSYVSMCLSVKDEHCDIREWALYYASLGVGKIYIFDTESDPPMQTQLDDLIASGLVDYSFVNTTMLEGLKPAKPGKSPAWQHAVFPLCLRRYRDRHRWMAFFDADEYLVLKDAESLPELLQRYEDYGGLQLHWQFFADSGHVMRPRGGVLRSYTACCGERQGSTTKSIVQLQHTKRMLTPHNFGYVKGKFAVNTEKKRITGPGGKVTFHSAVLNHYFTRSLADFEAKQQRRSGIGGRKELSYFLWAYRLCNQTCTGAVGLGEALYRRYNVTRNVPDTCFPPPWMP